MKALLRLLRRTAEATVEADVPVWAPPVQSPPAALAKRCAPALRVHLCGCCAKTEVPFPGDLCRPCAVVAYPIPGSRS